MDKKTIIALVIVGVIFLLWPVYMKKVAGVNNMPVIQPNAIPSHNGTIAETGEIKLDWAGGSASASDTVYYDLYFGTDQYLMERQAQQLLASEYPVRNLQDR